ncbi:hypothetical protein CFP56_027569 [Quercus suber]|uniref:Alkaline phytoceramidase n=1 Tax=Quercus suber TaxID=58331 RepID=A0AAW0JZ06_QUESU
MFATPKIPLSPKHHLYADMRNFLGNQTLHYPFLYMFLYSCNCLVFWLICVVLLSGCLTGVPNTLNVITNFPFLVVGVLGFVLCLQRNFFNIILRGELWGWALFYAGTAGVAFGSAYYHLKPDDNRVMWDTFPMMIAYSSLFSSFIVERMGEKIGLSSLFALISFAFLSTAYGIKYNDLRLCMAFQLIPSVAIPGMMYVFRPKYTHSRYWLFAAGIHVLAKFEGVADRKIYRVNRYIISGHSLEHLCLAMVPVLLSIMLMYRNMKFQSLVE